MNTPMNSDMIDRLVDGELDESERREAILALGSSPDGWRRCALAFLEAQEWTRAAQSWTVPDVVEPPSRLVSAKRPPNRRRSSIAAVWITLAFIAGFAARGRPPVEPLPAVGPTTPPVHLAEPSTVDPEPAAISAYVRSEWERRGYLIEQTRRLISMELDSGAKLSVPLDAVEIRYVGRETY
jgi:hypothetical protein